MFYNKKIDIYTKEEGHFDEDEFWIPGTGLAVAKTIECDVQPITKELAHKEYGLDEDVQYRIFCDPDPLLKNDTQIGYREQFAEEDGMYLIISIVRWDSYWILLINGVDK